VEKGLVTFCRRIRLLSERDTNKTVVHVFRVVLQRGRKGNFGSTEIAEIGELNRITCIHHLKRLARAGIIEKDGIKYRLKSGSLLEIVEGLRKRQIEMFDDMDDIAKSIDKDIFEKLGENHGERKARTISVK